MKRVLILSLVLAGGATAAWAQNPNVLQQQAPNMPSPQQMPAEKIEPSLPSSGGEPSSTGSTGTLSDKLQASDGVIRPPETGTPDMRVTPPVPNPGTTPVIPPPGSPGGNQTVDPK
jgi:hypothetical protein